LKINIIYDFSYFVNAASLEDLYCFNYQESEDILPRHAGWTFFNIQSEFQRQGVPNEEWSLSYLNTNYEVSNLAYIFLLCTPD
jgi:hypothetical protein